jgi:SAM-dependent methyltransferase
MKDDDTEKIWKQVQGEIRDEVSATAPSTLHPALAVGLGGVFLLNVMALLSLPPVLRGKGAPYLPSFSNKLDIMFTQLKKDSHVIQKLKEGKPLTFVDLGSGDGRVVFRAAREGVFTKSIGYEINPSKFCFCLLQSIFFIGMYMYSIRNVCRPVLHLVAQSRRCLQAPKYLSSTNFVLQDLWNVQLKDVDVVAVYGLNPIMNELGKKLEKELKPGSVVLSNVFSFPNWRHSSLSSNGVFVYSVPSCWSSSLVESRQDTDIKVK